MIKYTTKEEMLEAVKNFCFAPELASEELKNDKEVVKRRYTRISAKPVVINQELVHNVYIGLG